MRLPPDLESLRAPEWETSPPQGFRDEVNQPIRFDAALKARTQEAVAQILDYAAEKDLIVKTAGAITSSGSFAHPDRDWMEAHGKKGAILLTFSGAPDSAFSRIEVNETEGTATAGAAVSLLELRDAVQVQTEGRLVSPMRITTMDARLVATFLGSGGVSDACSDMTSLMARSEWMDGTGRVVKEEYAQGTYFDWSCFNRVNEGRVGIEMSGRGGPFGVGLEATTRLRQPYIGSNRFVLSFLDGSDPESIQERLLNFIHQLNVGAQTMASGLQFKPVAVEIMDKHSIALAESSGKKLSAIPPNTHAAVILDLAQAFGEKIGGPEEVVDWCLENELMDPDVVMDESKVSFVPLTHCQDVQAAEDFRLAGPDGARRVIKQAFPSTTALSTSTDYAVAAWERDLILEYGMELFRAQQRFLTLLSERGSRGFAFGYGHGSWRYDPHVRVVTDDKYAIEAFKAEKLDMGRALVQRQKGGRRVRVRGEKPEQPYGEEYDLIARNRVPAHQASNRALLEKLDPAGLFMHRAPERWKS